MVVKPGAHLDVPDFEYHLWSGLNATTLKAVYATSPAHVEARPNQERTDAMELGSAFHCLTLEPDKFYERYYIRPTLNVCRENGEPYTRPELTTKGKAQLAVWAAENEGKTEILARDLDGLKAAAAAVYRNPLAQPLLAESKKEVSLMWEDDFEGPTICKARLDIMLPNGAADLKSTNCAEPTRFSRRILYPDWNANSRVGPLWIQAAWYVRGMWALGLPCESFTFIAIELDPPFAMSLHVLEEAELREAQTKLHETATRWMHCVRMGNYPAYPLMKNIITLGQEDADDDAA